MTGRALRLAGSVFFSLAGGSFLFLPPVLAPTFMRFDYIAVGFSIVFILGGVLSALGVIRDHPHTERLGVAGVIIAAVILAIHNLVILAENPAMLPRSGMVLFLLACCMWASERWVRIGKEVNVLNNVLEESDQGDE